MPDRPGAIPRLGEEPDEPSLADLVERIEFDPAPGGLHGTRRVAGLEARIGESLQHRSDGRLDARGASRLPVVEGGTVAKGEPRQERPAGKRRGSLQVTRAARRGEAFEVGQIDRRGLRIQGHLRPADHEADVTDRTPERREGASERTPRRLVVGFRPEDGRQLVPGERAALAGDQRHDGQRLARVDHDRPSRDGHFERAEESDRERRRTSGHRVTVPDAAHIP